MNKIIIWIIILMSNINMVAAECEIGDSNGHFEEYVVEWTEDLIEATDGQVKVKREGNRVEFYFTSDMVDDCRMEGFAVVVMVIDGDINTYDIYEIGYLDGETATGWEHGTFDDDMRWLHESFVIGHMK